MNTKTSLILGLIFVVLGAVVLYDKTKIQPRLEEGEEKTTRIAWLKEKKIHSLKFIHKDGTKIEIACNNKTEGCAAIAEAEWTINEPVTSPGDSRALSTILNVIKEAYITGRLGFEEGFTRKEQEQYGLVQPEVEIFLNIIGEKAPLHIKVGAVAAIGAGVYVWSSAYPGKAFMVGTRLAQLAKKPVFHWREKRVVPGFRFANAKSFAVDWSDGRRFAFERVVGGWHFTEPQKMQAHGSRVRSTVIALENLKVSEILEQEKADFKGELVGSLKTDIDGEPAEMSVYKGKSEDTYQVTSSHHDWVGVVKRRELDFLQNRIESYRIKRLLNPADTSKLKELTIRLEDKAVVLTKVNRQWSLQDGTTVESFDPDTVKNLIELLRSQDISGFTAKKGWHQERWQKEANLVIELKDIDQMPIKRLQFYVTDTMALVDGELNDELRVLDAFFAKKLPTALKDLQQAKTIKIEAADTKSQDSRKKKAD